MTLISENESEFHIDIDYETVAREVINASLDYVLCPYECVINIMITDNEGIRALNHQMRGLDKPTDVLSFPGIEFVHEGDFSVVESEPAAYFDSETGELMLGDIMISLEKVIEQAKEYNHSVKREFAFLIAHSMLHLSGYDHMEEEERLQMETMQEEILQGIGYTRDIQ